jgi:hypothetical protein
MTPYSDDELLLLRRTVGRCECGALPGITFIPDQEGTWIYDPAMETAIHQESGRTIKGIWVCGQCGREYP